MKKKKKEGEKKGREERILGPVNQLYLWALRFSSTCVGTFLSVPLFLALSGGKAIKLSSPIDPRFSSYPLPSPSSRCHVASGACMLPLSLYFPAHSPPFLVRVVSRGFGPPCLLPRFPITVKVQFIPRLIDWLHRNPFPFSSLSFFPRSRPPFPQAERSLRFSR